MKYRYVANAPLTRALFLLLSMWGFVFAGSNANAQRNNYSLFFVATAPIVTTEFAGIAFEVGVDCAFEGVAQVVSSVSAANVVDLTFAAKGPGIDCQYPAPISGRQLVTVNLAGKPAGSYRINLRYPAGDIAESRDLVVSAVGGVIQVESLVYGDTLRYFTTANPADLVALGIRAGANSTGGTWAVWARADSGFRAWPASGAAPPSAKSVCRFFNTRVATHFYSANAADCAALRGLPDWVDEGVAFRTILPQGGVCQSGTEAVYRLFSQSLANHRYTRGVDTYQTFIAYGWTGEGVAFCSPIG